MWEHTSAQHRQNHIWIFNQYVLEKDAGFQVIDRWIIQSPASFEQHISSFVKWTIFSHQIGMCLSFFTRWNHTPLSCNERLDSFGVLVLKFLNTKYLHDFLTGVQLKAAFLLAKICGSCTPPQDNNMEGGVGAHNRALVQGCVPVFTSVNGLCLCL